MVATPSSAAPVIINTPQSDRYLSGYADVTAGNGESVNTTAWCLWGRSAPTRCCSAFGNYLHDGGLIGNVTWHDNVRLSCTNDYSTRARLTFLPSDAWTIDLRGEFGASAARRTHELLVRVGIATGSELYCGRLEPLKRPELHPRRSMVRRRLAGTSAERGRIVVVHEVDLVVQVTVPP